MYLMTIQTEKKNMDKIKKIVNQYFDGFTIIETTGFWKSEQENSIKIEIIDEQNLFADLYHIAQKIKKVNDQESVLIASQEIDCAFV